MQDLSARAVPTVVGNAAGSGGAAFHPALARAAVDLEIVIAAYNDEHRIGETLRALGEALAQQPFTSRIIVVDNGSVDRTTDIVSRWAARTGVEVLLMGCAQRGRGAALRRGMVGSQARYVGFCEAGQPTPVETLGRVLGRLAAGDAVVIASRYCGGAEHLVRSTVARRLGGRGFRLLSRPLVRGVADTECGFKFFRGDVARRLVPATQAEDFMFDVELIALALRAGLTVTEVPVRWATSGGAAMHRFRDGPRIARDLWRVGRRLQQPAVAGLLRPFAHPS